MFNSITSTSIHRITTDRGLPRISYPFWLFLNLINNSYLPDVSDPALTMSDFKPTISDAEWKQLSPESSPSRKWSDLFWMNLPWERIQRELREIHVFDAGCGSGRYGPLLQQYSHGRLASYFGADLFESPNWALLSTAHPNFTFRKLDSVSILNEIPRQCNFIISQSAIEHFQDDLIFMRQLEEFVACANRPVIQIHLFPSSACLRLYLMHGVRQYTPSTVSKLIQPFKSFSRCHLYKLGGQASNDVFWRYYTKPIAFLRIGDQRLKDVEKYNADVRYAMESDLRGPLSNPSFYALIIHSNFSENIFG